MAQTYDQKLKKYAEQLGISPDSAAAYLYTQNDVRDGLGTRGIAEKLERLGMLPKGFSKQSMSEKRKKEIALAVKALDKDPVLSQKYFDSIGVNTPELKAYYKTLETVAGSAQIADGRAKLPSLTPPTYSAPTGSNQIDLTTGQSKVIMRNGVPHVYVKSTTTDANGNITTNSKLVPQSTANLTPPTNTTTQTPSTTTNPVTNPTPNQTTASPTTSLQGQTTALNSAVGTGALGTPSDYSTTQEGAINAKNFQSQRAVLSDIHTGSLYKKPQNGFW